MPRAIKVEVQGLEVMRRAFRRLPRAVGLNVLEPALRAGTAPIEAAMRTRAPVNRGVLREAIATRLRLKKTYLVVLHVGSFAPHAHLVEFGHVQKVGKRGGQQRVVGHVPAHPFARPAYNDAKGAAQAAIRGELGRGIEREAERVGPR